MKIHVCKHIALLTLPVAFSVFVGTMDTAEAQRERPSRDERREQRREEFERMTPEQIEEYRRTRRQEWERNATPEQRQRMIERRQEWERQRAAGGGQGGPDGQGGWGGGQGGAGGQGGWGGRRQQEEVDVMANAGITDETVKEAIRAFVTAQQEARQPLLEMARQITLDLGKPEVTGEQIATRMAEFRAALVVDQKRYDTALQQLDAKIGYTKNPKLEAFLTMAGVLGYEAPQVGGAIAIFDNLTPPAAPATVAPAGAAPPDDGGAPVANPAPVANGAPAAG